MKGQYVLTRLIGGGNAVVMLGPLVLKRLAGKHARRRYFSERIGRRLMASAGIDAVPVLFGLPAARLIVMPRLRTPTLDAVLTPDNLDAFEQHVLALAGISIAAAEAEGYYWIDQPGRTRSYASFTEFLEAEAGLDDFPAATVPRIDFAAVRTCLRAADPRPPRMLVLTDVAPKNVVYDAGRFTHLDMEATLIGPPDLFLVRAAVNLATDCSDRQGASEVRARLLARCSSDSTARACLVFSLLRRIRYERTVGRDDPRPIAALKAVLHRGASLDDAVSRLEGSWDATIRV